MVLPIRSKPALAAIVAVFALFAETPTSTAQMVGEMIGPSIARFHASDDARAGRLPSLALDEPREATAALEPGFPVRPEFSENDGQFVTHIEIAPGTSLYGTGQAAGPLLRNGRVTEQWNKDAYGYQDDSPLYTSHPWVLAVRPDGSAFGVLADTTYRVQIDLTDGITFRADGPPHPAIVINGDSPQAVMHGLGELTGTITLPPKWAIGYHQCRYSYYPESRVKKVVSEFRRRKLPCDVIWMDIDYMDGYRCFTFNDEHFPDPAGLNAWLDDQGFQNVWMIDPGIKNEDGYFVHDQGDAIDAWVKRADGSEFNGHVWPGECVFPDFTNREVREWWAGLYKDYMAHGIDGVWNDMNEPAVFVMKDGNIVGAVTMPEDNLHRADAELGGPGPHARFHNVYGMLMVKATREGVMAVNPDNRPFVLSRANYIGGHRYGATWTGDNTSNWFHLDTSIPMVLNLSLSAQPFCGPDIGGFIDAGTPEMYARWIGFGALMPFARGHTQKGNPDKEPWSFGPEVEATARRSLERRYRLVPMLYTVFEESSRTGMPIARPLFFSDPADPALRNEDNAFLLGENLLVAVQTNPETTHQHAMPTTPGGLAWRAFDFPDFDGDGRDSDDPDQPTLFIRPGGIIPSGPVIQHMADSPNQRDELTLIICLDANGQANCELYEDAGDGWAYRDGQFLRSRYTASRNGDSIVISVETLEGAMPRPDRSIVARVLLPDGRAVTATGRNGEPIMIELD